MIADQDIQRLVSFKANQPWIKTTGQAEEVFRSNVDAIVIVTPVQTHYKLAREALLHGKHVLVEKPSTKSGCLDNRAFRPLRISR
jgi:predicted dehydrogenase